MQQVDQVEDTAEDAAFRAEVRAWLAEHAPAYEQGKAERAPMQTARWREWAQGWQGELVDARYAAITWPSAYGGRDGTSAQEKIFKEEARQYEVPRHFDLSIGRGMVAPTLFSHGTEEQKQRYLVPILRGDEEWCQLFSEPGAGSDLAGVTCRAERDGDEWTVNGQKVWTSSAHEAHFGILLARTDIDQPKHRGISYFVIDMLQPGVEIRPLRQMTGDREFSEVFLTDARVPHANLVGELNDGWRVANTTLASERFMMGELPTSVAGSGQSPMVALAHHHGVADDATVRRDVVDAHIGGEVLRYLGARIQAVLKSGQFPGPEGSVMKLMMGQNGRRSGGLGLQIQRSHGLLDGEDAGSGGSWQYNFLRAPSSRIAGGSDQIQRNILGERVLGLPAEPRVDKDVPFRDVPKNAV